MSPTMKIQNLAQLEAFLKTRIPTREALFMGDIGLKRAKYFMKILGNPQNKIKVIHIAGTSGKGSTAYLTSNILVSQGFKVGLQVSPHVLDIRERLQINNELPKEKLILKYFNQILPFIKKMEQCKYGMPTYFEILVGLAYLMFAKEKLDYAVIETGLGGKLDATNTVTSKNKICIITKIGLDHTEILGKTISKIASEKAGVIQKQNTTINIQQTKDAQCVINKRCNEKNSRFYNIKQDTNFSIISSSPQKTIFDFKFQEKNTLRQKKTTARKCHSLEKINLGLVGVHQAENCSLALECLMLLSKRDKFKIDESKLKTALEKITIPGRLEIRKIGKQNVIIDGAHNPQKMKVLTNNISKIYPDQKFAFIVAFKKGKDYKEMLKNIIPLADKIYLTQFSLAGDNHWNSVENFEISEFLKNKNFKNFSIIKNNKTDVADIIWKTKKPIVITGSLYLIGTIYSNIK
ncbi:MAG: hypothetical protein ACD_9C00161G0002 [uncultured bacterium]|nr:MAG: hypothetical protein ACD_9C00161G0002 [uncultured bacterium]